jgi:hypothetical protein
MRPRRLAVPTTALLLALFAAFQAAAQPAAPPGSICILPDGGWCWAVVPGRPGEPCQCPTLTGWVQGTLR